MKQLLQIFTVFLLFSCSDSRISEYEKIINQVDKIQIEFKSLKKRIELNSDQVEMFKEILKRNIKPTIRRKFESDIQVDLYSKEQRIGFLMITDNDALPFINFGSEELNFGFRMTYGIGMYLNEEK